MLKMILEIVMPLLVLAVAAYVLTGYGTGKKVLQMTKRGYRTIRSRFVFAVGTLFSKINLGKEFRLTKIVEQVKNAWSGTEETQTDFRAINKKESYESQDFQSGRRYRLRVNM